MKYVGVCYSNDPDARPEADFVCEFCGQRDIYVYGWTEPIEAGIEYFKNAPCRRCGRVSNAELHIVQS